MDAAAVRGLAAGQCDLRSDATVPTFACHARIGGRAALLRREIGGELGLKTGRGAGESFEGAEQIDSGGLMVGAGRGGEGLDPVFDIGGGHRVGQAPLFAHVFDCIGRHRHVRCFCDFFPLPSS